MDAESPRYGIYCRCGRYLEIASHAAVPLYDSASMDRIFKAHMVKGCAVVDRETWKALRHGKGKKRGEAKAINGKR